MSLAYNELGVSYYLKGNFEESVERLNKAIELD